MSPRSLLAAGCGGVASCIPNAILLKFLVVFLLVKSGFVESPDGGCLAGLFIVQQEEIEGFMHIF